MGVYSNIFLNEAEGGIHAEELPPVDVESLVDDKDVEAAYEESAYDAALRCCYENTVNFNNIMQACAISEFCYLEENGQEMVYTEASLKGFFDAAVDFFKKIWEKIQSIFKKVAMQFKAFTSSDKEFLTKYKKQINKAMNNGFGDEEVNMYDYTFYVSTADKWNKIGDDALVRICTTPEQFVNELVDGVKVSDAVTKDNIEEYTKAIKKLDEDSDIVKDALDGYRGRLLNLDTKISANEFLKEIAERVQRDTTKDSVELGKAVAKALPFLEKSKDLTKALNDGIKRNKKSIDDSIRAVKSLEKSTDKKSGEGNELENQLAGKRHSAAGKAIAAMKAEKNILVTYNGAMLQHLKACSRQSKAICVKAATYKVKTEGAYYDDDDMGFQTESDVSLLNAINMI